MCVFVVVVVQPRVSVRSCHLQQRRNRGSHPNGQTMLCPTRRSKHLPAYHHRENQVDMHTAVMKAEAMKHDEPI